MAAVRSKKGQDEQGSGSPFLNQDKSQSLLRGSASPTYSSTNKHSRSKSCIKSSTSSETSLSQRQQSRSKFTFPSTKSSTFEEIAVLKNREKHFQHNDTYSIHDCRYPVLPHILRMYGFYPQIKGSKCSANCIWRWAHWVFMFLCESLGLYTLIQLNSNTQYNTNYYGAIVSLIYPILYVGLAYYFTQTTHFWNLCRSKATTEHDKKCMRYVLYLTIFLSLGFAAAQKSIWATQQDKINWKQDIGELLRLIVFAVTFVLRLGELFLVAVIFWIVLDFHYKQVLEFKAKIKSFRDEDDAELAAIDDESECVLIKRRKETEVEILNSMFSIHTKIYLDISYTNGCVLFYLTPFLCMVAIGFIIIILGLFLRFVDIWQFWNNIWELVLMFVVSLIVLLRSAHTTWQLKRVKKRFIEFGESGIISNHREMMEFVNYFETNKVGIKIAGLLLDYGVIVKYAIALASSVGVIVIRSWQNK